MEKMTLEETIILAAKAHEKQQDKAGAPYILHPIRVMLTQKDEEAMKVALLHDILEDTTVQLNELRELGFSDTILSAVQALTRENEESYDAFILRVMKNPLAKKVKIADLKDNMNLDRIFEPSERDFIRLEKYKKALEILENSSL